MILIDHCHLSRSPGGQHGGKLWVVYLAMDCGTALTVRPSGQIREWGSIQIPNVIKSPEVIRKIKKYRTCWACEIRFGTLTSLDLDQKTISKKIWIRCPYQICMKEYSDVKYHLHYACDCNISNTALSHTSSHLFCQIPITSWRIWCASIHVMLRSPKTL